MTFTLLKGFRGACLVAVLTQSALAWGVDYRYQVSVNEQLDEVAVRAWLTPEVRWLSAQDGESSMLLGLTTCDGERLRTSRRRIVTGDGVACLDYRYPLADTATDSRSPPVVAGVVVSSPNQWLWTPRLTPVDRVLIELSLPARVRASVPWRSLGGDRFELLASPRSSRAVAVFGGFEQRLLELPGAQMRVALIGGPDQRLDSDRIIAWLRAAARDVADVYGRFPNPSPQVIVQPSQPREWGIQGSPSAVPFGYVIRDGGEAVRFFVDAGRPLADYLGDWTATHEFSHLLLPYISSRDRWISEGFASYYQNVLLARRGIYTEQEAWRRLHRSFEKARAIKDPPTLNRMSDRPFWEMRMLIYWSGAALALMADVELRQLSDSAESLDTVLERLQACCLPSERSWTGGELFSTMDTLTEYPVFQDLYRRYAYNRGMPSLEDLYSRLGVVATGSSSVELTEEAPDRQVRVAIMGKRES
ncbi:MAG: hypothetical protein O7B25_11405 [Gammaproteobacteria bacterium]|nr:hypothetical protein [Gammaproteobacteria bacterium]